MYFDFSLYVLLDYDLVARWGINYMLVHLKVLGDELDIMVQIVVRVVLQKCMDCLEKKFVLMVGDCW